MKNQVIVKAFIYSLVCLLSFIGIAETNSKTEIRHISKPNTPNVEIGIYGMASYMITSRSGVVISTDAYQIPEDVNADIITVSHTDIDHIDRLFIRRNKEAKISINKVEKFNIEGINVTGIAASHFHFYKPDPEFPRNVIYLFEVDDLRIAHTGDLGQNELTQKQLETLRPTNILFIVMMDLPQWGMLVENSLKIVKQLKPKVIIPTHLDEKGFKTVIQSYDKIKFIPDSYLVSREDIKDQKGIQVVIIENNYGPIIKKWKASSNLLGP